MNCDRVFDILTRGPFPSGDPTDAAVERHLAACYECHRLAEALRPAVELFHEAVDPEESRELPGYWTQPSEKPSVGEVFDSAVFLSDRTALSRRAAARQRTVPRRTLTPARGGVGLLTAVALGVLLALAVRGTGLLTSVEPHPLAGAGAGDRMDGASLSYVNLTWPSACYDVEELLGSGFPWMVDRGTHDQRVFEVPHRGHPAPLMTAMAACTHCHSAGATHWLPYQVNPAVARACLECHQFGS